MPVTFFPTNVPLRMPVTRRLGMPVRVIEFLDGTEQRFAAADPLNAFELTFADVRADEVTPLMNFLDTVKGEFDSSWSFVGPDGVTYPHMALEQDELSAVENRTARWTIAVKMRQVAIDGAYAVAPPAAYPTLANGVYTQRPFTRGAQWLTTRNDLPSGARYAYHEWGAHKRSWSCEYPVLTLTEVQSRITFFIGAWGRLREFSFTDPETADVAAHCRLDMDELTVKCVGAGQWATGLKVAEYFV